MAQLDPQVVKRWEELDNVTPAEFLDGDGGENARFGTRDAQVIIRPYAKLRSFIPMEALIFGYGTTRRY